MKLPADKPKSNPPSRMRLAAPAIRVLLVDDDPSVLRAVKRALAAKRPAWILVTAPGPVDAMCRLEGEVFDVVVSDFEMPRMNGVELMKHAKRHQPSIIRVILSGLERKEAGLVPVGLLHAWLEKLDGPTELIRCCEELWHKRNLRKSSSKVG